MIANRNREGDMRASLRFLAVAALSVALAACGANKASIFRDYEAYDSDTGERTNSVLIDAKQRAILAAPAGTAELDDKAFRRDVYLCAEPSPDALSAISSTFAGSLGGVFGPGKEVQGALAAALSETASELGKRNATIQLLRDGLYRQCEAYMNGLIDKTYYEEIAHKYVNAMVTLLAIEELTPGAATATQIGVADGATVSADAESEVSPAAPAATEGEAGDQPATGTETETPPPQGAGTGQDQGGSASGQASAPAPTVSVNLPGAGTKIDPHVSAAVNSMVTFFLVKDTVDFCLRKLSALSREAGGTAATASAAAFAETCEFVVREHMAAQGEVSRAAGASAVGGTFGRDSCGDALKSFWQPGGIFDQDNQSKIEQAMADLGIGVSLPFLINTAESAEDRQKVGQKLNLPDCL
jgi:hypothetical protein